MNACTVPSHLNRRWCSVWRWKGPWMSSLSPGCSNQPGPACFHSAGTDSSYWARETDPRWRPLPLRGKSCKIMQTWSRPARSLPPPQQKLSSPDRSGRKMGWRGTPGLHITLQPVRYRAWLRQNYTLTYRKLPFHLLCRLGLRSIVPENITFSGVSISRFIFSCKESVSVDTVSLVYWWDGQTHWWRTMMVG